MKNISGSPSNWVKDPRDEAKKNLKLDEVVEEVVEERKVINPKVLKDLIRKLEQVSSEMNMIYQEAPNKNLSDSSIMLNSVISSLQKNISKN